MEKKNFIFKNVFYIFFALCFFSAGFFALNKTQTYQYASAEDISNENVFNQNIPEYFLAEEFLHDFSREDEPNYVDEKNSASLIDHDTFMFFSENTISNRLKLSLATNGVGTEDFGIYGYVYYPNPEDHTKFHFYDITNIDLKINGQTQTLAPEKYINAYKPAFENLSSIFPEKFEMNFTTTDEGSNDFNIMTKDENGRDVVREGLYTLTLKYTLITCTDGREDGKESNFSTDTSLPAITYNFYVVNRDSYFENNLPILNHGEFDQAITNQTASSLTAHFLYSNYTSKQGTTNSAGQTIVTDKDNIPYVEFDFTKFELDVKKEFSNEIEYASLRFNKDFKTANEKAVVQDKTNNQISHFEAMYTLDEQTNKCKIYFADLGNYTLTLKAIKIVEKENSFLKYQLEGVSSITKNVIVNMFGYQATYTDFDQQADDNNTRPVSELKEFEKDIAGNLTGKFINGADITSKFVNSKEEFSQDSNSTFTRANIVDFLNTDVNGNIIKKENHTKLTNYALAPVSTNQTPIKFLTNANLVNGVADQSYVLTTKERTGFVATNLFLQGERLYQKTFTGQTENASGTYIYIIPYTYKDHASPTKIFYQVFFFEIEKGTPSISVTAQKDGKDVVVYSDTFINQDVKVVDTTKNNSFNKDVTVQIYAFDYQTNKFMTEFGGVYGISLAQMMEIGNINNIYSVNENSALLQANAHYYVRLYYSSDLNDASLGINTNFDVKKGFCSEQAFTVDKLPIQNIKGRNVVQKNSDLQIVSEMKTFATNQNMVLSWDKKQSGASSYAYYRYFPLVNEQYYSTQNSENVSRLLADMLGQGQDNMVLPVNNILNLKATNNWIPLAGSTSTGGNTEAYQTGSNISSEFVLSDAGLYLVDIYDASGNHKLDIFFIDDTAPVFAIRNDLTFNYALTTPTTYIDSTSTLYWGNFKGIYIANFNSEIYRNYNSDSQTLENLNAEDKKFYTDHNGKLSSQIYELIYQKLYQQNHMQFLSCPNTSKPAETSNLIDSYSGMYMTIKINDVSYYANTQTTGGEYEKQSKKFQTQIVVADKELNLRVLIRDLSNTKYDLTLSDEEAERQYTNYFSARQTIKVSFDDSKFTIKTSETNELSALYEDESTNEAGHRTKISYLSPVDLRGALTLNFVPTTIDAERNTTTQVENVTIQYYRYITEFYEDSNHVKHYYKTLSTKAENETVYDYNSMGEKEDEFSSKIGISNTEQITNPGKYVITRTYKVSDGFTYNSKDFFQRTYVLIVDRHEVVTSPETVDDGHAESLVGGDIFVAMFDNGLNSSIVVTFPNSPEGNSDGQTIFNSNGMRTILTTNKLPVNIYIPQYKYTKYVAPIKSYDNDGNEIATEYDFEVENNNSVNNYRDGLLIKEYALYAQLKKDGQLIATTAFRNSNDPKIEDIATDGNGFLKFYRSNGTALEQLKEAGIYTVTIYQGWFGEDYGKQPTEFQFEIKSATPNFSAQLVNGTSLNKTTNDTITPSRPYSEMYETNNSEICLIWEASTDKYMVEIDVDNINLVTKNGNVYNSASDIWTVRPFEQNNHTYMAQLNLEKLSGVYENDGWVDITMQFENQDSDQTLYKPVTKRIYVDLSAPSNNINNLVSASISDSLIKSLTEASLRSYQTAKNQTATDLNNTSFNISNPNGTFAYYSYTVAPTYLNTLKSSVDFKTYLRKFVDGQNENTKYVSGQAQETSPAEFSPNNFIELSDRVESLDTNCYYEVVETDKAGNMTIYTIYVVDSENNLNLISYDYKDSTGAVHKKAYTKEEFDLVKNKKGAISNINCKTGFTLTDINFFGDEWAQINLVTRSPRGDRLTKTLMLTPHDKGFALVFEGNKTPERVAISSLIDGNVGSIYKHSLNIRDRVNMTTESFYVNIYNTSITATLTDQANTEYIKFNKISDAQIQDTTRAYAYLTQLKITAYTPTQEILLYGSENNSMVGEGKNPLGYASDWMSNNNVIVENTNALLFRINPELSFISNARIVYEFTDNYGTSYKEIHIYNESVISQEIPQSNDLYSFLDENGTKNYIKPDDFQFVYNPNKYVVQAYSLFNDGTTGRLADVDAVSSDNPNGDGTYTLTVSTLKNSLYNDKFVLRVADANNHDANTNLIKQIYFTLYNELPTPNMSADANKAGQFRFLDGNGTNVTNKIIDNNIDNETGYYSEIRIQFSQNKTFIPVKYSISTDKQNWEEISSDTKLRNQTSQMQTYYLKVWYDQQYLQNADSNSTYVFENVPENQIFEFNLSSLTAIYWVEKTVDGVTSIVNKDSSIFQTSTGVQYANHYIINLNRNLHPDAVEIKVNKEQEITKTKIDEFEKGNVVSELWFLTNKDSISSTIPAFETYIVLTYIPKSENFAEFYASNENGILENENLIAKNSTSVVISEEFSSVDKVQLQWTKFYGIQQNEIKIKIIKDGQELNPEIYSRKVGEEQFNYTYLTYSGKYSISLYDSAGNIQKFNLGSSGQTDSFTFIFLKDVPFTVSYTNIETGEIETVLPIKQAVYNGPVTLNIDATTRPEFYMLGGYPTISVKKNGLAYNKTFEDNATQFTFDEAGYYEITFTATSNKSDVGVIRKEAYQFTILNPDEHKISYVYNQYSNYYVEKVIKDGRDITNQLTTAFDFNKIVVGGKEYLSQLALSYLDEKTGVGTYIITINSNNQLFKESKFTAFSFKVTINKGTAPLKISLAEGKSTTKRVDINFNAENIFKEMGECALQIVRQNDNGSLTVVHSVDINASSTGESSTGIDQNGTFFIQIVAPSGNLLFSYKVVKKAPMNAASIIAIVISAIVLIAVFVIIFKLRKRIAVK